jgi:hypothetical protein
VTAVSVFGKELEAILPSGTAFRPNKTVHTEGDDFLVSPTTAKRKKPKSPIPSFL